MEAVLTRTPDSDSALTLWRDAEREIKQTPQLGLRLAARRLLNALTSLWASNQYLASAYAQTKQENAGLHNFMAATIKRYGEIRFTKEELGEAAWNQRIRGYCIPGSTDVVFRVTDEPVLLKDAPKWLAPAVDGHPVANLINHGEELFLPVFDITDLDGTQPKVVA